MADPQGINITGCICDTQKPDEPPPETTALSRADGLSYKLKILQKDHILAERMQNGDITDNYYNE